MNKVSASAIFCKYPGLKDRSGLYDRLAEALVKNRCKLIVLDDDPTGVQTIHDLPVYTGWDIGCIRQGFAEDHPMFFILTNSRSFSSEKTISVHEEIARNILAVSRETGKDFLIINRGDSTLRGHYPLETEILRQVFENESEKKIDGEIIIPFFLEGGRYTAGNVHYVQEGDFLIPAGRTDYAADKTFGYKNSHLGKWIEEKTSGRYSESGICYIELESIRETDIDGICIKLASVKDFGKVVVNALEYDDLRVFLLALLKIMAAGKKFLFRTAASFVKIISGLPDKPLLTGEDLFKGGLSQNGGLIIAGSHVGKTTEQLEALKSCENIKCVEFNQHTVLNPPDLDNEVYRVASLCNEAVSRGQTVAVYTRRERLDINTQNKEDELRIAVTISEALSGIVKKLEVSPAFIIAKGGITSSDVATRGLGIKRAVVAGQIKPGIPVWVTGAESRFPGIPYVIFPGNVGSRETLKEVAGILGR